MQKIVVEKTWETREKQETTQEISNSKRRRKITFKKMEQSLNQKTAEKNFKLNF